MRILGEDRVTWRTLILVVLLALSTVLSCAAIWVGLTALGRAPQ